MKDYTKSVKNKYNRIAKIYDLIYGFMERKIMHELRKQLWGNVSGKVLEVGIGTGANIEYYPTDADITAIDFSENMIEIAARKATKFNRKVNILQMDVQALEFEKDTFDYIITTCVFCSVPDPIKGLSEIKRVCKDNGKIIMIEHVRSNYRILGRIMDIINPLTLLIQGVNINRKTVENIKNVGITVNKEKNIVLDVLKYLECGKLS